MSNSSDKVLKFIEILKKNAKGIDLKSITYSYQGPRDSQPEKMSVILIVLKDQLQWVQKHYQMIVKALTLTPLKTRLV